MKNIICTFIVIISALIFSNIISAGVSMQDGLWEITSKMEMTGMPVEMPAVKFKQCLDSQNNVPYNGEQNHDCKISNTKVEGDTVAWDMSCAGNMKSSGSITYKGSTFSGSVNVTADGMKMTQTMNGRRIGECK